MGIKIALNINIFKSLVFKLVDLKFENDRLRTNLRFVETIIDEAYEFINAYDHYEPYRSNISPSYDSQHLASVTGLTGERQNKLLEKIIFFIQEALLRQGISNSLLQAQKQESEDKKTIYNLQEIVRNDEQLIAKGYGISADKLNLPPGMISQADKVLIKWLDQHKRVKYTFELYKKIEDFFQIVFYNQSLAELGARAGGDLSKGLEVLDINLEQIHGELQSKRIQLNSRLLINVIEYLRYSNVTILNNLEDDFFEWLLGGSSKFWNVISALFRAHLLLKAYAVSQVIQDDSKLNAVVSFQKVLSSLITKYIELDLKKIGIEVIGSDVELLKTKYMERKDWQDMPHGDSPLIRNKPIVKYLKNPDIPSLTYMDIYKLGFKLNWITAYGGPFSIFRLNKESLR